MSSVLIATPCYGKLVGEGYLKSILSSFDLLRSKGHQVELHTIGNESLITRARNNQVAYFLTKSFDYLMFIDADISWNPEALLALLDSDSDVCGIPYPTKARDWKKVSNFIQKKLAEGAEFKPQDLQSSSLNFTINLIGRPKSH